MKSFTLAMHVAMLATTTGSESDRLDFTGLHVPRRSGKQFTAAQQKEHIRQMRAELNEPVHGQGGWELAKYEWRADGSARFLYIRNTGERRSVIRSQKGWCVNG